MLYNTPLFSGRKKKKSSLIWIVFDVKKKTSKYVTLSKINKTTSCQGHIEYNTSVIICTAKKKNHKRTEVNEIEKKKFWIKFSMIYLNIPNLLMGQQ